jgi:hypothetical protein
MANKTRKRKSLKKPDINVFIKLAKKYNLNTRASKKKIAEKLSAARGSYLSKREKDIIIPYLANNKNKKILLKNYNTRKKLPRN